MADKMLKPEDLDFSYNMNTLIGTDLLSGSVIAIYYLFFSIRTWLGCKMYFKTLKEHKDDDAWLKKEYAKLLDAYKERNNHVFTPAYDAVNAVKWRMEACYTMLKTPKKDREKIDYEFVVDEKYKTNGIAGKTYKIINKNAKPVKMKSRGK